MKKFINHIWCLTLLAASIVLVSSCNDFFDVEPENGHKTSEYYRTIDEVNGAALGIYAPLAQHVHQLFLWGSARADMVTTGTGSDAYTTEFVNNEVSVLNPYTNYAFLYQTIARCNHHLEHLCEFKTTYNISDIEMEVFYGEAYFVRALCYYYLVRTFEEVPLLLEDISNNVRIVTENNDTVSLKTLDLTEEQLRAVALQPTEKSKIWASIMSDLNKAITLLETKTHYYPPYNYADNQWVYGRASQAAVYTLSAEVALWMGLYERASSMAEFIVVNRSVGSQGNWSSQFTGNGIDGGYSVFMIPYQYANAFETNRMQEFTSNIASDGGKYMVKPALEVVENTFSETKDVRRVSWMMVNRQPVIWKYIGKDEGGLAMRDPYQSDAPFHIFKCTDGFFLKGIAENRLGNPKAALEMLNQIRKNRGLETYKEEDISLKMIDMEDRLFQEKARETAFEGRRFYDLMLMEKFGRKGILAEKISKKYPVAQREAVKAYLSDESHWYLPIEPERWSKVNEY